MVVDELGQSEKRESAIIHIYFFLDRLKDGSNRMRNRSAIIGILG